MVTTFLRWVLAVSAVSSVLVFLDGPISDQERIEALVLNISGKWDAPLDELRVGPTRHSVMVGTKPLK